MQIRWLFHVSCCAMLVSSIVEARAVTDARPRVLPEAEERDLALEALPPLLREDAGVWVMTREGYRELRRAKNGYTCIVNRDEVDAIKPTCYDPEGTATLLPVNAFFGDLLVQGVPVTEIRTRVAEGFRTGRFKPPSRVGIAFMMSPRIVNVMTMPDGTMMKGTAPPHYMIYAPNVTNDQLSLPTAAYDAYPWLPYVAYTGPGGFLIVTLPEAAEAAAKAGGKP